MICHMHINKSQCLSVELSLFGNTWEFNTLKRSHSESARAPKKQKVIESLPFDCQMQCSESMQ